MLSGKLIEARTPFVNQGVVHGGLLFAREKKFGIIRFTVPPGLLLTTVWLPLCCPSTFFQAARQFRYSCVRVSAAMIPYFSAKRPEIINSASQPLSTTAVTLLPDNNTLIPSNRLSPYVCFESFREVTTGGFRIPPPFARTENCFDSCSISSSCQMPLTLEETLSSLLLYSSQVD
jgi:hypothetical protein